MPLSHASRPRAPCLHAKRISPAPSRAHGGRARSMSLDSTRAQIFVHAGRQKKHGSQQEKHSEGGARDQRQEAAYSHHSAFPLMCLPRCPVSRASRRVFIATGADLRRPQGLRDGSRASLDAILSELGAMTAPLNYTLNSWGPFIWPK